jgi:hypothetical protein
MSILVKEVLLMVPFLPMVAALSFAVRGSYIGE